MTTLLASVFSGLAMLFGGLFGGHHGPPPHMASSTPSHWMASSTDMGGDMGTSTPGHMMGMAPGIMGKVTAIDGTSLMVNGHGDMQAATTTYTVDASSAKVIKIGEKTAATVASIKVGDSVMIEGTVTGSSVVAKTILDGVGMLPPGGGHMMPMMGGMHEGSSTMRHSMPPQPPTTDQ